jgi:hypothetical protein
MAGMAAKEIKHNFINDYGLNTQLTQQIRSFYNIKTRQLSSALSKLILFFILFTSFFRFNSPLLKF